MLTDMFEGSHSFVSVADVPPTGIVVTNDVDQLPRQRGPHVLLRVTVVVPGMLRHHDNDDAAGVRYSTYRTVLLERQEQGSR